MRARRAGRSARFRVSGSLLLLGMLITAGGMVTSIILFQKSGGEANARMPAEVQALWGCTQPPGITLTLMSVLPTDARTMRAIVQMLLLASTLGAAYFAAVVTMRVTTLATDANPTAEGEPAPRQSSRLTSFLPHMQLCGLSCQATHATPLPPLSPRASPSSSRSAPVRSLPYRTIVRAAHRLHPPDVVQLSVSS
jgi:hypothetical protein